MQYYWRYVEGRKMKPGGAMKLGLGVHAAAAHNFIAKADTGTDLKLSEQTDYFADWWDKELKSEKERDNEVQFQAGETPGAMKDQGVSMVKTHHEVLAPTIQPLDRESVEQAIWLLIAVEQLPDESTKSHFIVLPGLPDAPHLHQWKASGDQAHAAVEELEAKGKNIVLAYQLDSVIDVTDREGTVRELKTKSGNFSQLDADKLIDLSHYDFARRIFTHQPVKKLALDYVNRKPRVPEARTVWTARSLDQLKFHLKRLEMLARTIEAKSFIPRTDWWGCDPRYCGYWPICAGKNVATIDMGGNLQSQLKESVANAEKAKTETQRQTEQGAKESPEGGTANGSGSGGRDPDGIVKAKRPNPFRIAGRLDIKTRRDPQ
jgi:hypothetical protein